MILRPKIIDINQFFMYLTLLLMYSQLKFDTDLQFFCFFFKIGSPTPIDVIDFLTRYMDSISGPVKRLFYKFATIPTRPPFFVLFFVCK